MLKSDATKVSLEKLIVCTAIKMLYDIAVSAASKREKIEKVFEQKENR